MLKEGDVCYWVLLPILLQNIIQKHFFEIQLRCRILQVVKVELPFAIYWREFVYFCNSCLINGHIDDKSLCLPGKLAI